MKKWNLSDFKAELQELVERHKRKRKENKTEILTGHLDFWYEFMRCIMKIYGGIFVLIGFLSLNCMNHGNLDEMTKVLGSLRGNKIFLAEVFSLFMIMMLFPWGISVVRGYRTGIVADMAALLSCYMINTLLLKNEIPVFTLKGMTAVFLGAMAVKFLLIKVMELAGLPSRNVVVCHSSDIHRKKTGYWWY